jgi:hypothetical protein
MEAGYILYQGRSMNVGPKAEPVPSGLVVN